MIRINVKQGTPEWHEVRYRKIGGSTSKGLFVKVNTLRNELIGQFLEDFEDVDNYLSADMERGNELEPYAIKELNKYTGLTFNNAGWLQCEEIPLLGISPDGITDDNYHSCEVKCPGRKKHTETILNGGIPLDHLHQCLHYFTVNPELETHTFASFRPENKIKPLYAYAITRDCEINLGTKAKPVLKKVSEWVEIAKTNAKKLQIDIDLAIKQLEF
jgi:hypothetical protein